jgi:hypothetical protein
LFPHERERAAVAGELCAGARIRAQAVLATLSMRHTLAHSQ